MHLAGGFGKYQFLAVIVAVMAFIGSMLYVFSIPFFIDDPAIECYINNKWVSCSPEYVCDDRENIFFRYVNRLENFVSEYDLLCDDPAQEAIPSAYFTGVFFSCLFFSVIGDVYGRLPLLIMGQLGNLAAMVGIGMFSSYEACLILSGVAGFFTGINQGTPFNFLYDSMEEKYSATVATVLNCCWASGEIMIAYIMLGRTPWRIMLIFIICWSAAFIFILIWIREAPRFHYSTGNFTEFSESLQYIAKRNGVVLPTNIEFDKESLKLDKEKEASMLKVLKDIVTNKTVLFRTILLCIAFFLSMLIYYGISINLEKFEGDMVVNGVFNALAEIVGVIIAGFLFRKFGQKQTLTLMFSLAGFGLFMSGIFADNVWLANGFIYLAKSGSAGGDNTIYIFAGEMFPNTVKNAALAFGMVIASVGSMIAPLIGLLKYFPMVCVLAVAGASNSLLAWLFPIKKPGESMDTVEQLNNNNNNKA